MLCASSSLSERSRAPYSFQRKAKPKQFEFVFHGEKWTLFSTSIQTYNDADIRAWFGVYSITSIDTGVNMTFSAAGICRVQASRTWVYDVSDHEWSLSRCSTILTLAILHQVRRNFLGMKKVKGTQLGALSRSELDKYVKLRFCKSHLE